MSLFSLRWSSTQTLTRYVLLMSAREKSESYPLKPQPLFSSDTSCDLEWRAERERAELTGDKLEPKHMAVIKARLLNLQLITDFQKEYNNNHQKKKLNKKTRCYDKIVNTSIALETGAKIHRKKKKFSLFLFIHCVGDQKTCNQST